MASSLRSRGPVSEGMTLSGDTPRSKLDGFAMCSRIRRPSRPISTCSRHQKRTVTSDPAHNPTTRIIRCVPPSRIPTRAPTERQVGNKTKSLEIRSTSYLGFNSLKVSAKEFELPLGRRSQLPFGRFRMCLWGAQCITFVSASVSRDYCVVGQSLIPSKTPNALLDSPALLCTRTERLRVYGFGHRFSR